MCLSNVIRDVNQLNDAQLKRQLHSQWARDPGCKQQPLFSIPLDHVIVDELHLECMCPFEVMNLI